jgi:hypothetical protein
MVTPAVTSQDCRRFQAGFHPGAPADAHRRSCPSCAAYAEAMERAAEARLPLPAGLRGRLQAIARPEAAEVPSPILRPLPQRPLPEGLRQRLREIPQKRGADPGRPPAWVLSPRYAVAASYALAVLLTGLLGNPVDRGRAAAEVVSREVGAVLERTGEELRGLIDRLPENDSGSWPVRNSREPERRIP